MFIILAVCFVGSVFAIPDGQPEICTDNGCILGVYKNGFISDYFEAFLGIPFAQPPVNNLRFANPVPLAQSIWRTSTKFNASTQKSPCIQKNYLSPTLPVYGEEDCLYLNVYRPPPSTGRRNHQLLPVMFYIHGGGFVSGSTDAGFLGPDYFMDTHEVIIVIAAYRLGAFGFLSTGDLEMPGNFGLKDQTLALKWVQENIQKFGGNPNLVTIFGQSAGASSAHMHMLSPLSKGLFHRTILMSGAAIGPFFITNGDPLDMARQQAEFAGVPHYDTMTTKELTNALRNISAMDILSSGDKFKFWSIDPVVVFRAVVEKPHQNAFITKTAFEIAKSGQINHTPVLVTFVKGEGVIRGGAILSNKTLLDDLNANLQTLYPKLLEVDPESIGQILDYYLGDHKVFDDTNKFKLNDIYTDRSFYHPMYKTLQYLTKFNNFREMLKNPISVIKFDFKGRRSYSPFYTGSTTDFGVSHCDDLIYLFRSPILFQEFFEKNSIEARLSNEYVQSFITFAKTGKPLKWARPIVHACNYTAMVNSMCEYQHIINAENENKFEIQPNNEFDVAAMQLWDNILHTV